MWYRFGWLPSSLRICVLLGGLGGGLAGCGGGTASGADNGGGDDGDGDGIGGDGQGGHGGGDGVVTPAECEGKVRSALSIPITRLTAVEYRNTLRDLLPGVPLPALELPADELAGGFDNLAIAQTPSARLIENLGENARAIAAAAEPHLGKLLPCLGEPNANQACGERFVREFGARAFRRPLTTPEEQRWLGFFKAQLPRGLAVAVARTLEAFVQAPQFIYRLEPGDGEDPVIRLSGWELASRLSYFLWDTMPDDELREAAQDDELSDSKHVTAQVERMLDDPRARPAIARFHEQWLRFEKMDQMRKDPALFPKFDDAMASSLRAGTERFVEDVFFEGLGWEGFVTDRRAYADDATAPLYGLPAPRSRELTRVALPEDKRAGILTQAGLLAAFAHPTMDAPVLRGVFVLDRLLCMRPPDPPENVSTAIPEGGPDDAPRTTRQLLETLHQVGTCRSCHIAIDGIGFGFSHYDALGAWRTTDSGVMVDASGALTGTDVDGAFTGAVELGERLKGSEVGRKCVARQWTRYALGLGQDDVRACDTTRIYQRFADANWDMRALVVAVTNSELFRTRERP
jgi:hypothetical protein